MSYNKVASADITLTSFNDLDTYSAEIISSNGSILQPFDLSTTLIGSVYKNNVDITDKFSDFRWTKFTPTEDNLILDEDWTNKHRGMNKITVSQDDVNSKAIFYFEVYKNFSQIQNDETLIASDKYTIIDVNDLLTTTKEPENPYQGQVWVNDSTDPATIRVWNGYKWIVAGAVGAVIKNMLKGTGFLSYSHIGFEVLGDTKEMFTLNSFDHLGKRYLKLHSEIISTKHRGIKQTTIDKTIPKSGYSFQTLYYSDTNIETFSNNVNIDIYLIGENDIETLVVSKSLIAETNVKQCFYSFETLYDTKAIRVEICGEDNSRFNFNIAELALYNTKSLYPWTPHPLDASDIFDRESLFNVLTDNGRIEGIFSKINPETGQLQYYINASYIGAGLISAKYLDVYGLTVYRKDQPDIKTLEITEDGDITLCVKSLTIKSTGKSLEDYMDNLDSVNQSLTPEAMTTTVNKIVTTEEGIQNHITTISEQTATAITNTAKNELSGEISKVEQTAGGIRDTVTALEKKLNYKLVMEMPDGTVIKTVADVCTVYGKIYDWDIDVTDTFDASSFNWYRKSHDLAADNAWHTKKGIGKKSVVITKEDIIESANFYFTVEIQEEG